MSWLQTREPTHFLRVFRRLVTVDWESSCSEYATYRNLRRFNKMNSTEAGQCRDMQFKGKKDRFNGVTVSSLLESCCVESFPEKLKESLKVWSSSNVRTVWFSVALQQADWIPILAKNGFRFHHTAGEDVVMFKWLPTSEPCNVPPYAHTMIGVGAVVINDAGRLLTVQERYSPIRQWKLPGGYVDPGENIGDAAIREVFEETNIKTQFLSLITFRHMHNANFGCSDIYFIARLKPLTEEIEKCNREINACMWMKVEEFLEHPEVHDGNKFFVRKCVESQQDSRSIGCTQSMHAFINRPQCVYSIMGNEDIPVYSPKL